MFRERSFLDTFGFLHFSQLFLSGSVETAFIFLFITPFPPTKKKHNNKILKEKEDVPI